MALAKYYEDNEEITMERLVDKYGKMTELQHYYDTTGREHTKLDRHSVDIRSQYIW